jgi:hypothetical protein
MPLIPSARETEIGRVKVQGPPSQEISQAWWCTPVIPTVQGDIERRNILWVWPQTRNLKPYLKNNLKPKELWVWFKGCNIWLANPNTNYIHIWLFVIQPIFFPYGLVVWFFFHFFLNIIYQLNIQIISRSVGINSSLQGMPWAFSQITVLDLSSVFSICFRGPSQFALKCWLERRAGTFLPQPQRTCLAGMVF